MMIDTSRIYDVLQSDKRKSLMVEEYKDERGADKTSRKQRCGDCYRKI